MKKELKHFKNFSYNILILFIYINLLSSYLIIILKAVNDIKLFDS